VDKFGEALLDVREGVIRRITARFSGALLSAADRLVAIITQELRTGLSPTLQKTTLAEPIMTLRLLNTLSGNVDPVVAEDGKVVRMYACGPTVYDYGHIGNFRTSFRRCAAALPAAVRVRGPSRHEYHDVDDKIIRNATAAGVSIRDYAEPFEKAFLRIWTPSGCSILKRFAAPPSTFRTWSS